MSSDVSECTPLVTGEGRGGMAYYYVLVPTALAGGVLRTGTPSRSNRLLLLLLFLLLLLLLLLILILILILLLLLLLLVLLLLLLVHTASSRFAHGVPV